MCTHCVGLYVPAGTPQFWRQQATMEDAGLASLCEKSALPPCTRQTTICGDNTPHPSCPGLSPVQVAACFHADTNHWVGHMHLKGGCPHFRPWEAAVSRHRVVGWCRGFEHIRELGEFQHSPYPAAIQMAPKVTTMPRRPCTQFAAGQLGAHPRAHSGCSQPAWSQRM